MGPLHFQVIVIINNFSYGEPTKSTVFRYVTDEFWQNWLPAYFISIVR